jgi:hypothetical protein
MWRGLIQELTRDAQPIGELHPGPEFLPGATPEELTAVERELGVRLPQGLTELLGESNGVLVDFGQHLIWSTDEITRRNREMRTDPQYRENYLPSTT